MDSVWFQQKEDVFYSGHLLHKSKGKLHKYQSMRGMLRFESAMGWKRLELYYPDFKDQNLNIIYPHTLITFANVLGLHSDHTIRPGVFPFQLLTTDKTYHFATKTKEEQQEWLNKMNRLLFGPPLPEQIYEFHVMAFPLSHSEKMEMVIRGNYLMRINDQDVILISKGSLVSLKIPLLSISRVQHTVLISNSTKFAPFSDNKSIMKTLAICTTKDCDLGIGTYAFAAISAPDIVAIINKRKIQIRKLPPLPCQATLTESLAHNDNGFLTHEEVLKIVGEKSSDKVPHKRNKSTSPSDLTPKRPGRLRRTSLSPYLGRRSIKYSWDETFSASNAMPHENVENAAPLEDDIGRLLPSATLSNKEIKERKNADHQQFFFKMPRTGVRVQQENVIDNSDPRKISCRSKNLIDVTKDLDHHPNKPSGQCISPGLKSKNECHPKRMFLASMTDQHSSKATKSTRPLSASEKVAGVPSVKLTDRLHQLSNENRKSVSPLMKSRGGFQQFKSTKLRKSHSLERILDSGESDVTYINLQCLLCSKEHNWDKTQHSAWAHHPATHKHFTNGTPRGGFQQFKSTTMRKSHSLERILDSGESDVTYINLQCLLCSKEHNWDKTQHSAWAHHPATHKHFTNGTPRGGFQQFKSTTMRKSHSLERILDPEEQKTIMLKRNFLVESEELSEFDDISSHFMNKRSCSLDMSLSSLQQRQETASPTTSEFSTETSPTNHHHPMTRKPGKCFIKILDPSMKQRSFSEPTSPEHTSPNHYERILNDGPYEQIPNIILEQLVSHPSKQHPFHNRSYSDSMMDEQKSGSSESDYEYINSSGSSPTNHPISFLTTDHKQHSFHNRSYSDSMMDEQKARNSESDYEYIKSSGSTKTSPTNHPMSSLTRQPGKRFIKTLDSSMKQRSFSEPATHSETTSPNHYERILNDGHYDRIPNIRLERLASLPSKQYPFQNSRSYSESMTLHMDEQIEENDYEYIRNSGPYEQVPNFDIWKYLSKDSENNENSGPYERVPHSDFSKYGLNQHTKDSSPYEKVPHFDLRTLKTSSSGKLSRNQLSREVKTPPITSESDSNTSTQKTKEVVYRKDPKLNRQSRKKKLQCIYSNSDLILGHNNDQTLQNYLDENHSNSDSDYKPRPQQSSATFHPLQKRSFGSLDRLSSFQNGEDIDSSKKSVSYPRGLKANLKIYAPPTTPNITSNGNMKSQFLWSTTTPEVLPYAIVWLDRL